MAHLNKTQGEQQHMDTYNLGWKLLKDRTLAHISSFIIQLLGSHHTYYCGIAWAGQKKLYRDRAASSFFLLLHIYAKKM